METQKINSKSIILNYGLILGIASVLFSVAIYAMDGLPKERPFWQKAISITIMIATIILGIKKFKELNNGYISLGQAMKTGVGIALIGGIISGIYVFIFFSYIESGYLDQVMQTVQEKMLDDNPEMSDEQIEMAMNISRKFSSPTAMLFFSVIGSVILGSIISLVGGLFLKKENQDYI
jgi:hypothetical protein